MEHHQYLCRHCRKIFDGPGGVGPQLLIQHCQPGKKTAFELDGKDVALLTNIKGKNKATKLAKVKQQIIQKHEGVVK